MGEGDWQAVGRIALHQPFSQVDQCLEVDFDSIWFQPGVCVGLHTKRLGQLGMGERFA